jgi:hypothetical protein
MSTCREFREELAHALEGRPRPSRLVPLSWDEHLLSCGACRGLLEAEHALEVLLASLPEPRLPEELAQRVLIRLRAERAPAADLDTLLEEAPAPVAPSDLSSRVLAGLESERRVRSAERRLDEWLDLVPEPVPPEGLAADVLDAVRAELGAVSARAVWLARLRLPLAAAGIAAAMWLFFGREEPADVAPAVRSDGGVASTDELDDEMVAAFDVLDNWDHLNGEDVDLLLASIEELDELLFEASEWEGDVGGETDGTSGG